jgi:hypothetical protein
LPDCSWYNIPNREKIYPNNHTKWPQKLPNGIKNRRNGHKICQHRPLQGIPKFTQTGSFGLEMCHLATLKIGRLA